MSRNLNLPYFPIAPEKYERKYFDEVIRTYSTYLIQIFTALQTDDSGLEDGGVFNHGGALRVPVEYSPYVRGFQATGEVGSVTVST